MQNFYVIHKELAGDARILGVITMHKDDLYYKAGCTRFLKATGSVISKKRKQKNITQKELGLHLNVSESTISRYEDGKVDMPVSVLPMVSSVCDFPMTEYAVAWEDKSVKDFFYKALKGNAEAADYFATHCTDKESEAINCANVMVNYIVCDSSKEMFYTLVVENYIKQKNDDAVTKRMTKYMKMIQNTKKRLSE